MALQNIGIGNRNDAFYRYKMPRLVTKIEGRGNGIKTNLVNMVDVAKALARPPAYVTKFYGCELGAQSRFDEKTGTVTVNGAHETAKLASLLENFIKKYVQCYGCGNPETEVIITKSQMITLKCAACGFTSNVDMRDKLTAFILKNPPVKKSKNKGLRKAENERVKEGEAVDAEMKRSKKELKKKGHDEEKTAHKKKGSGSDEEGHSSTSSSQVDDMEATTEEVEWLTDTSAKAAQQRIKEQLSAATSQMVMLDTISDEKENDKAPKKSGSENQVAEGKGNDKDRTMNGEVKSNPFETPDGSVNSVDVASLSLQSKLFKDFKGCLDSNYTADQMAAHLKLIRPCNSQQEVMNAFFDAMFDGVHKGLAKEICRKKQFLIRAIANSHDQALLLGAVEAFFASESLEMCKEVAVSLKTMYDLDVLEEEVVLAWYKQGTRNKVKERARPFVEWLQNAESEEDE